MNSTRGALLVVNDDPTQLRLACALLERQGYRVHAAAQAAEALRTLEQVRDIAGVVTDLHMPEIDGWRFCRLLRSPAYKDFNHLPVLVVSATFSGDDAVEITRELGANGFLPAPYPPAALTRYVRDMLEGRSPASSLDVLIAQRKTANAVKLARTFRDHGYVVHVARSLARARRLFLSHEPGIVVLDHTLDEKTPELLADIKRPGTPCVAVVTTTEHRPDLALELMRKGADAYVREAYQPEFVLALCERARRQRALLRVEELLEERTLQLRDSEQQLRAIFRALPEIVLAYDREGIILQVNPAATLALERDSASLLGRDVRSIVAPDQAEEIEKQLGRTGAADVHRYETTYVTPQGRRIDVEVTESRIRIQDEDALLAVARDIGARRRAQEELALLAAAVQQAAEMIVVTGTDGKIRYVNPAFESITGYTREEALGSPIDTLRSDDGQTPDWRQMQKRLQTGRSWRGRARRKRKDGRTYVAQGTVSPVRDESGAIVYYVGVEQDVTQEEELENALRQAQKMEAIGTLAGGVAHDFNNLLTGILGYANLIVTTVPPGSELAQMAQVIESSAERASHLTKELLGFARRGKFRNVPIDLNETVEHVVHLLSRSMGKHIRLATRLDAEHAQVLGDPSQVEQALLNLAINARDALGDQEGELAIATQDFSMDEDFCARHPGTNPGSYVLVTVADDGCGMSPEVQSRIFEPFFTTKNRGEGTGMGLSMTYGIIKNHGGSISVYSEVGHGTAFKVYLPLDEQSLHVDQAADAAEPIHGTGRVLIVDDEEIVRHTASTMLKRLGYEVVTVADGEEALLYYRHFGDSVDLVLLDMVMPGMGGHDCFSALKEVDADVRVVLSTGFGLNDAAQAILDAGALGFAQKPYRVADLSQVVAAVLRGERLHATDVLRPPAK